jgi:hypothetical protein
MKGNDAREKAIKGEHIWLWGAFDDVVSSHLFKTGG